MHTHEGPIRRIASHARAQGGLVEAGDGFTFVLAWKTKFSIGQDNVASLRDK
jgi:hypothetical protein